MVAIKNISITATLLSGVAYQALAAPIPSPGLALRSESGDLAGASGSALEARALEERDVELDEREFDIELEERELDAELDERDLEERKINGKKILGAAGKVGKGLFKLLFRDLEGRDLSELNERDFDELVTRYIDEGELDTRDLEERKVNGKKILGAAGKVGKGLFKLLFRDLEGRDVSELDERDIDDLVARYIDDAELDTRDLEERKVNGKKFLGAAGKVGKGLFKLLFRDLEGRDVSELDERDIDDLMTRYIEDGELDTRDFEDLEERDLEERKINGKKVLGAAGKVGKGLFKLLFRDLEGRDVSELDERDIDDLMTRYIEDGELDTRDFEDLEERDLEERKINGKKILGAAGKVGKGLFKLLFRDLEGRDISELDERDIDDLMTRYIEDEELDTRDFEDLEERDLEERKVNGKKILGAAGKVGKGLFKLLFRDLEGRDVPELDERDLDELATRYFDEAELEARDFEDIEERDIELDERDLEYIYARYLEDME